MMATKMILLSKMRQKYIIKREKNQQKLKLQPANKLMINIKKETSSFLKQIIK